MSRPRFFIAMLFMGELVVPRGSTITSLTGVVPRAERFKLIAEAKLVLYPSHVDSSPYSVLESLMLGTLVVAYDIPALRLYYGSTRGVYLVREGDVEALSKETIDVLSSRTEEVEPQSLEAGTIY
ncbi:MAG: glycosyltransferase [Desulfurococcaceae archaeon]